MASRTLKVEIIGDTSKLSRAFKGANSDVSKLEGRVKSAGHHLGTFGKLAGGAGTRARRGPRGRGEACGRRVRGDPQGRGADERGPEVHGRRGEGLSGSGRGSRDGDLQQDGDRRRGDPVEREHAAHVHEVRNETGKGNDIFTQATKVVTDMSVALGQDGTKSAIQLGKALNDPIKGVTALARVGVTFTQGQKDQIKTLEEHRASPRRAEAHPPRAQQGVQGVRGGAGDAASEGEGRRREPRGGARQGSRPGRRHGPDEVHEPRAQGRAGAEPGHEADQPHVQPQGPRPRREDHDLVGEGAAQARPVRPSVHGGAEQGDLGDEALPGDRGAAPKIADAMAAAAPRAAGAFVHAFKEGGAVGEARHGRVPREQDRRVQRGRVVGGRAVHDALKRAWAARCPLRARQAGRDLLRRVRGVERERRDRSVREGRQARPGHEPLGSCSARRWVSPLAAEFGVAAREGRRQRPRGLRRRRGAEGRAGRPAQLPGLPSHGFTSGATSRTASARRCPAFGWRVRRQPHGRPRVDEAVRGDRLPVRAERVQRPASRLDHLERQHLLSLVGRGDRHGGRARPGRQQARVLQVHEEPFRRQARRADLHAGRGGHQGRPPFTYTAVGRRRPLRPCPRRVRHGQAGCRRRPRQGSPATATATASSGTCGSGPGGPVRAANTAAAVALAESGGDPNAATVRITGCGRSVRAARSARWRTPVRPSQVAREQVAAVGGVHRPGRQGLRRSVAGLPSQRQLRAQPGPRGGGGSGRVPWHASARPRGVPGVGTNTSVGSGNIGSQGLGTGKRTSIQAAENRRQAGLAGRTTCSAMRGRSPDRGGEGAGEVLRERQGDDPRLYEEAFAKRKRLRKVNRL
jgi:hypothetical protein